eukprot:gb/GFBE01060674.1/.p1 GENE.gb/GFBE01060674.1/~~gb/GFBE01060674.1/.p1  ORF type:complete len:304 (+),score=32.91 gb/GFBE01060674.1/:1-912(+)
MSFNTVVFCSAWCCAVALGQDSMVHARMDASSSSMYLATAPNAGGVKAASQAAVSSPSWQYKAAVGTPVGVLAACWMLWSRLLDDHQQLPPAMDAGKDVELPAPTEMPPRVPVTSHVSAWLFLAPLALGVAAVVRRQRNSSKAVQPPVAAAARLYRMCTEQLDEDTMPHWKRALSQMSAWSDQSIEVSAHASLYRMQTEEEPTKSRDSWAWSKQSLPAMSPRGMDDDYPSTPPTSWARSQTVPSPVHAADEHSENSSRITPRNPFQPVTARRQRTAELVGAPKEKIREIANKLAAAELEANQV